jgi:Leucine-rich repeat (LRR) protein
MKCILLIICIFISLSACDDDEKAVPDLTVNPSLIEFENIKSTKKFYITSNTLWEISSSNKEWCQSPVEKKFGNDTVEINVEENVGYHDRIAYISVNNPEKTIVRTVKVIQKSLGQQMFREEDSTALVGFYDSMGGGEWTDNTGWKTANLENWYGITVKNDRITGIKMENNNLSGQLIAGIENLTALDTLSIVNEKNVTGSIPLAITGLPNLKYLNISETSVSGNIPAKLGNLNTLEELILSENLNLTGTIPNELGNLSNLKRLVINNLTTQGSIPAELGNLHSLKYLALDSCNLNNSVPIEISGLSNLEYLSLNNNKLTVEFPSGVTALTKLKHLILSNNNFLGTIPAELANLELETLWLENNYFNGSIPAGILDKIDGIFFKICPQKYDIPSYFSNLSCD